MYAKKLRYAKQEQKQKKQKIEEEENWKCKDEIKITNRMENVQHGTSLTIKTRQERDKQRRRRRSSGKKKKKKKMEKKDLKGKRKTHKFESQHGVQHR